jgi:DNA end-binding protein Ku
VGEDGCTLIPRSALLLAWEFQAGQYVVFRKSELEALRAPKSGKLQILECVDPRQVDLKYYAESFDVWPGDGGEKGYEVLWAGLGDEGLVAIGELPLFQREQLVMIRLGRHGLVLHKLFFAKEVNFDDEYHVKRGLISAEERELARTLVRSQKAPWEPGKYSDKRQDRLLEFVFNKCQSVPPANGDYKKPRPAPVVNIEDALRRSIELMRKPPERERGGSGSRKRGKRPRA